MLKINLLPQKKSRKADAGQQVVLAGLGIVLGVAALVWLFVYRPLQAQIESEEAVNAKMRSNIKTLKDQTKDYDQLKKEKEAAEDKKEAFERLRAARAVPAWMLFELSTLLTKDQDPTMSKAMAATVRSDKNKEWVDGWDPKHVWITRFEETRGNFKLTGGAQSDSDMTQLALRMQASMYFTDVIPQTGNERLEKSTGVSFYTFTITGKVVY